MKNLENFAPCALRNDAVSGQFLHGYINKQKENKSLHNYFKVLYSLNKV
jgi:hypothetical protein